jgi:hypothetical protein
MISRSIHAANIFGWPAAAMGEEHQRQMLAARVGVGVGVVGSDGVHGLHTVLLLLFLVSSSPEAASLNSISYILGDGAPMTLDHGVRRYT